MSLVRQVLQHTMILIGRETQHFRGRNSKKSQLWCETLNFHADHNVSSVNWLSMEKKGVANQRQLEQTNKFLVGALLTSGREIGTPPHATTWFEQMHGPTQIVSGPFGCRQHVPARPVFGSDQFAIDTTLAPHLRGGCVRRATSSDGLGRRMNPQSVGEELFF